MVEKALTEYLKNGKENGVIKTGNNTKSRKIWMNFQINEWTFTLVLVVISLTIVIGKLYINYDIPSDHVPAVLSFPSGSGMRHVSNMAKNGHGLLAGMYDIFENPQKLSNFDEQRSKTLNERFMNVSQRYVDRMTGSFVGIMHKYSWLLRALLSGLGIAAFSWFIVYKDSDIPGVNPPIPFSPRKTRFAESSGLQINYLIGILNGVLVFIYMCL